MEYLKQIKELFYSNEIELAIQLINSQKYDLRNVLEELYNNYKDSDNEFILTSGKGNANDHLIEIYPHEKRNAKWALWAKDDDWNLQNLNECLDKLTEYLENYG